MYCTRAEIVLDYHERWSIANFELQLVLMILSELIPRLIPGSIMVTQGL